MAEDLEKQVVAKVVSSFEKVLWNKEPQGNGVPKTLLKGERLHLQIAYKSELPYTATQLHFKVKGKLAPYITIMEVENVPVRYTPSQRDDYYLGTDGLFPDIVKPISGLGFVLPNNVWRAAWLRVYCADGLPVGKHTTVVGLYNKSGDLFKEIAFEIEVLDVALPKNNLLVTNWMHYDCICHKHKVKPFTKAFYEVLDKYLEVYTESGCNMLLTPIFTPPLDTAVGTERDTAQLVGVEEINGKYRFDFRKLKEFIRFALARGIEYFEFSHLFTQWGGQACPKIIVKKEGELVKDFGWDTPSTSEKYAAFLSAFLPALVRFLKKEGIKERCYLHLTDEPREEHTQSYEQCANLVKKYADGIPVMDAISHRQFYDMGLVDIPVCYTPTFKEFAGVRGEELFVYYCGGPTDEYYSNRFINLPGLRTRILGVQLYESGVLGFLHWGFNFYNSYLSLAKIDPYAVADAGFVFPAGDGFIAYPSENGAYTSIRAELQQEAVQDHTALRTLETYIGREEVIKLLHEAKIEGFTRYPRNETEFSSFRERINEELRRLSK